MRFAVLSNVNLEPLRFSLKEHEIYFGGYGQYMEELIRPESILNTQILGTVFLHLDGTEFIKELSHCLMTESESQSIMADKLQLIFNALSSYIERHPGVSIILSTVVLAPFVFSNYLDLNAQGYSRYALEGWINEQLIKFSQKTPGSYLLDWRGLVVARGYDQVFSEKFWYLGRMRYSPLGYHSMADGLGNLMKAIRGQTKKILVLDLDNTLWGGILGEDGFNGIELSEDGIGKAYRDFQREIKSLMQIGVLLAMNSKNNWDDVAKIFLEHPMMILKKEDFVNIKVNWDDKVENMKKIAEELNVGLESFVFVDDNPRERARVQESLPQISVPDFPQDPVLLKPWFLEKIVYEQFPKVFLTDEDHSKLEQYKAASQRKETSKELSLEAFINLLEVEIKIHINDRRLISRTAQLTQKTNQFNMTTKRYTESQITQLLDCEGSFVFNLDYRDRFGQEGVVGVAIVQCQECSGCLDLFLLSCRVIGRHVEYVFLYHILKYLRDRNIQEIRAPFVSTAKNKVAEGFYHDAGLSLRSLDQIEDFSSSTESVMDHLSNKYMIEDFLVHYDESYKAMTDKVQKHG